MGVINCPCCGCKLSSEAVSCPYCGKNIRKVKIKKGVTREDIEFVIFLLLISLPTICGLFFAFTEFQLGLWFTLGVVVQALFLIQHTLNKNILKNFFSCIIASFIFTSLLALYFGIAFDYLSTVLIFFCFIFSIIFHFIFRKKIIYKINEGLLIIWNIFFLYIYFSKFSFYNLLTPVFIILTIINFVIILTPQKPKLFWKIFLYCWLIFIMIFISIYQLDFKIFKSFFFKNTIKNI